jgi:hypothetical protein
MNMRNAAGDVVISRGAVTIVDANLMQVKYVWQSGQTGVAGLYHIEFEALLANGKIYTFPSKGFVHLEIEGDIA